jgi:hypothetical protein
VINLHEEQWPTSLRVISAAYPAGTPQWAQEVERDLQDLVNLSSSLEARASGSGAAQRPLDEHRAFLRHLQPVPGLTDAPEKASG